ncbi:Cyclin PHO80-like [Carpediemonas membranifera]|uniref:Cyclin PHO80-like n=1 Tax=Carpediemonas membranifera TaxID=201153 RepID=A0A8J6AYU8_9EUKA|nr:Cyclin PHO80-like [Carpediemonas membranifera]|eukprot:KAG9397393.1 Cyclin PHO80-like [Carpediemonas membranifera]
MPASVRKKVVVNQFKSFGVVGEAVVRSTVNCIWYLLKESLKREERAAIQGSSMDLFEYVPLRSSSLSLYDIVRRIAKYSEIPKDVFVIGILYIDKVLTEPSRGRQKFFLTKNNVNTITLTSMMLAQKYYVDTPLDNKSWAWIGNIPLSLLNKYEMDFLRICQFKLTIAPERHAKYLSALDDLVQRRQEQSDSSRDSSKSTTPRHPKKQET